MRAVFRGVVVRLFVFIASVAMVFAQAVKEPAPENKPSQLGPATPVTAQEAEDAAKTSPKIEPVSASAPVDPKTYVIGPEDILAIRVWKEPELTTGAQVRPDGKISMNLIGEVTAAGKTPEQLRTDIVSKLSEFVNKPEVTVSIQQVLSRKFYITGEVGRPGTYPLVVPTNTLQALTNAGGFREFANTKKITILREGKTYRFNYKEVVKGKNPEQNIMLQSGDYIIVP